MSLSAQRFFLFFFDARLSPLRLPARSLFIETQPNMEKRTAAPRVLPARRTSASLLSERRLWCRALAIIAPTGNVGLGYDYQNGGSFFFSAAASTHLLSAARPPLSLARRVEFKQTWLQTFRSVTLFIYFFDNVSTGSRTFPQDTLPLSSLHICRGGLNEPTSCPIYWMIRAKIIHPLKDVAF